MGYLRVKTKSGNTKGETEGLWTTHWWNQWRCYNDWNHKRFNHNKKGQWNIKLLGVRLYREHKYDTWHI